MAASLLNSVKSTDSCLSIGLYLFGPLWILQVAAVEHSLLLFRQMLPHAFVEPGSAAI